MRKITWGIGVGIGVIIAAAAFILLRPHHVTGPYHSAQEAQMEEAQTARRIGADPIAYHDVRRIEKSAYHSGQIDPADFARIKQLANDPNQYVRARALTALFRLRGTPVASDAMALARAKLRDQSVMVRQYALSALYRLGAPDAQAEAQRVLQTETDRNIRATAQRVIERR